jgi:hypothetical protein
MTTPSIARRRWRMLAPPILALALLAAAAPAALGGYQATVDVNDTAFDPVCLGFEDSYPEKMITAATAAYKRLGYATTGLPAGLHQGPRAPARRPISYYALHGDRYQQRRQALPGPRGFGDCSQSVVFSKEIRPSERSSEQPVIMSTCYSRQCRHNDAGLPRHPKDKVSPGAERLEFYASTSLAWDRTSGFEQRFWDALANGHGASRPDLASLGRFRRFDADQG